MIILDGKKTAENIRRNIKLVIDQGFLRKPGLAFILIGDHSASKTYVNMKSKACLEVGILSKVIRLKESTPQLELAKVIHELNYDSSIDGILIQQPFPKHLDAVKVLHSIDPAKDVDGFHALNLGKMLMQDDTGFIPCTPLGILELLKAYNLNLDGKNVVVLGRSLIVGRPIANLLSQKRPFCNATVTICHSGSENLNSITKTADVLIAAVGISNFIKKSMIKQGCIIIDVGINRIQKDGNLILTGDVDFEDVAQSTSAITPVPGGVGPMTIAMLLQNTLKSFLLKHPQKLSS